MVLRQAAVDGGGQRAGLNRSDAHDADAVRPCRGHDVAGFGGIVVEFQTAGGIQQVGDALHGGGLGVLGEDFDDRVGVADTGQAPGGDQALCLEFFEGGADLGAEQGEWRQAGHVWGVPHGMAVGRYVGVQEKDVEAVALEQAQAGLDGLAQGGVDPVGGRVAQAAFAGEEHVVWQPATESVADDAFRLAVAVARREVEQVDASGHGGMHRGDALVEGCLAPKHAEPSAAEGQGGDRKERTEGMAFHRGTRDMVTTP